MKKGFSIFSLLISGLFLSGHLNAQFNTVWEASAPGICIGVANCDDDNNMELLIFEQGDYNNNYKESFRILDGITGEIEYNFQADWVKSIYSVQFVDVNNNGKSEILMSYLDWYENMKIKLISYGSLGIKENGEEEFGFSVNNFPNPFLNNVTIEYEVPGNNASIMINIFNQMGKLIRTINDNNKEKGIHKIVWDGTTNNGNKVKAGIYYYSITIDDKTGSKTMIKI